MQTKLEQAVDVVKAIAESHGKERPQRLGGGNWDFFEEIENWKVQIQFAEQYLGQEKLTPAEKQVISKYIDVMAEKASGSESE